MHGELKADREAVQAQGDPGGTVCRYHGGGAQQVKPRRPCVQNSFIGALGTRLSIPAKSCFDLSPKAPLELRCTPALLQEAFGAAERLKEAHANGANIEAIGDENADTAETARRDLDRIFNTGRVAALVGNTYERGQGCRRLRHR
jgi:hypothetical protein